MASARNDAMWVSAPAHYHNVPGALCSAGVSGTRRTPPKNPIPGGCDAAVRACHARATGLHAYSTRIAGAPSILPNRLCPVRPAVPAASAATIRLSRLDQVPSACRSSHALLIRRVRGPGKVHRRAYVPTLWLACPAGRFSMSGWSSNPLEEDGGRTGSSIAPTSLKLRCASCARENPRVYECNPPPLK